MQTYLPQSTTGGKCKIRFQGIARHPIQAPLGISSIDRFESTVKQPSFKLGISRTPREFLDIHRVQPKAKQDGTEIHC